MSSECKICSMKFKNDSVLLSHINIHIGRKCKTCDIIFASEPSESSDIELNTACRKLHQWLFKESQKRRADDVISYNNNYLNTNPIASSNDWQCKYCEYKACTRTRLTKHMRTHTNERPFKCQECGRRFTVSCNLKQHILSIHSKIKPYKCSICSLGFIRRDKLREHKRIHTGEKPYKCDYCKQAFARRSSMRKHIKLHVGFKCRYCENKFDSEAKLRSHKKIAHKDANAETGTKWFKFGCNLCQKRFFTHKLLQQHLKLHKGHPCNECCNVFDTKQELEAHKCKTVNRFNAKTVIQTSKPLKKLTDKISKDSDKKHYCFECDKYFQSGSALGGHRSQMHSRKRKQANNRKKKVKIRKKNDKSSNLDGEKSEEEQGENALDKIVETLALQKDVESDRNINNDNKFVANIFGEYDIDEKKKAKKVDEIKQKKKKETMKDCPARHGLKKQLTPNNRVFECDECRKTMYLNEEMYGCRYCNYDLCVACYLAQNNQPKPWIFDLFVDDVLMMMNVSVNHADLEPLYRCNKMICYKEARNDRCYWCEYIQNNDIMSLNTEFMQDIELKCDSNKTMNDTVFINPNVFDGNIVAIKILSSKYSDRTMKAVLIKIHISSINMAKNKESDECKSMRCDYDCNMEDKKNINNIQANKKRKRNVHNMKTNESVPKRRKLTIKIPRLKKTNTYFTVEYHKSFGSQSNTTRIACNAWYNDSDLRKEYESIHPDIIPSLSLTDFNNKQFLAKYEYINLKQSVHWLIPNILLIGREPTTFIRSLVDDGFTTYISLYEYQHEPYKTQLETASNRTDIELIAFTITDYEVEDDTKTVQFVENLTQNILRMNQDYMQHMMYMHCYAGHGRTGLISCLLLQAIYGMNGATALKFLNEIHSVRHSHESDVDNEIYKMPETHPQHEQVQRLQDNMMQIYHLFKK